MERDPKSLLRQLSDVGLGVAKSFESERAVGFVKALISSMDKTVKAIDKYLKKGKDALEKGKEIAQSKGKGLVDLAKGKFAEVKDTGLLATAKKTTQDTKSKFKDMFASDTEKANGPPQGVMGFIKGIMPVRRTEEETQFIKDRAVEMVQEHVDKTGKSPGLKDALAMIKALKAEEKAKRAALKKPTELDAIINKVEKPTSLKEDLSDKENELLPKTRLYVLLEELGYTQAQFDALLAKLIENPTKDFIAYFEDYIKSLISRPNINNVSKLFRKKAHDYIVALLERRLSEKNSSLFGKLKSFMGKLAGKALKDESNPKGALAAMKDKFVGSFKKQKERMSVRQKEIDEEKAGAKTKDKTKAKGPLGMIISAIGALGGVFTSGVSWLLGGLVKKLPGLMLRGMGGLFTKLLPSLSNLIAPAASKLIGAGAIGGLKLAGGAVLNGLGTAAAAVGTAIISPIGVGVIAVGIAAFSGYKLYKYFNRNNTGSGISGKLTRLRLLSYGYNEVVKEHYNKVLDMDMLVKDYVSVKDGSAVYKKFDAKFKKSILEIFSIARTDKLKYELLNTWFIKRYVPAHAGFMNAYYSAGGKTYLDDLDKLNPEQTFKFISSYRLQPEVFDQKSIPVFEAPDCTVSKADVEALIVEVTKEAKEGFNKDKDKKAGVAIKKPTRVEENKAYNQAGIDASDRKFIKPKEEGVPAEGLPDPSDRKFTKPKEILTGNEEGEKSPPASVEKAAKEENPLQSTVDKVTKAPGPLKTGDGDLVGIKSKVSMEKIQNLDPNVLNLLSGMTKEYSELTGKSITVNEAFRTRQDQEALKASKGAGAAAPGTSLHEFGIAVDISSADADTLDKMGLMRKYGFTRPIGGETWHIEPAGVSLNPGSSKADPQERMKNILSSPGRGGGGLGANRGLPSSMKYKRDMALQKTLFNSGASIESPVEVADLKKDQDIATEPIIDSKPVAVKVKATGTDPYKMLQSKQEGLDTARESKTAEGPQLTKAMYKPAVQDKKIYSDYSEGEKPPKKTTEDANANLGPKEAIMKASQVVGVDYIKLLTFAKMESSLRTDVKADTSSATGLFQIVGRTWEMLLKKYGSKYNIPPDAQPSNAYYNSVLGAAYAKENIAKMQKFEDSGIRHDVLIYLAHHFGPSGGTRIARAYIKNPDSPIQTAVSDDAYKANIQELGNKTVRQYIDFLTAKFNKAGSTEYADKTKPAAQMKDINKVYGDDYDYNTGQNRTTRAMPVGQMAGKPSYPVTFSKQVIQKPRPDFGGNRSNTRANSTFSGINGAIGDVGNVVGGINGVFNNISKGITDTTSILNKGMNPAAVVNATRQAIPQQPSVVMNLDKTESLLMNMDDTLTQIKVILQSINDKGVMMPAQAQPATAQAKEAPQSKEPIRAPNYNAPSTQGVSMSRRSVLM